MRPAFLERANKVTYFLGSLALTAICLGSVADSASRNLGAGGLTAIYDLSLTLLVFLVFVTLGAAQLAGANPEFTLVLRGRSERARNNARIVGLLASVATIVWIAYISMQAAVDSYADHEVRLGIAQLPTWPGRAAVALGFAWLAVCMSQQIVGLGRKVDRDDFHDQL